MRFRHRVYPRAGGGTSHVSVSPALRTGLSPRRRGNHLYRASFGHGQGSIPAQAGEPCGNSTRYTDQRVYPRAGGGTARVRGGFGAVNGLSPRRRGNLDGLLAHQPVLGSIPAQAGEPRSRSSATSRTRVYPRAGGGTITLSSALMSVTGLSPRRRGNRRRAHRPRLDAGSIPAQAGEPSPWPWRPSR